jgi:hypothetical protein
MNQDALSIRLGLAKSIWVRGACSKRLTGPWAGVGRACVVVAKAAGALSGWFVGAMGVSGKPAMSFVGTLM